MDTEKLNELTNLTGELARLTGRAPTAPPALPGGHGLHPELAEVVGTGALSLFGVDVGRMAEFTRNARSRGLRRRAQVFGWHPRGHTWYAAPENTVGDPRVLVIHRLDRLNTDELTVDGFVERCIEEVRGAIAEAAAPPPEPEPEPEPDKKVHQPKLKGRRQVKVVLPESAGATVTTGDRTEDISGPDLAYAVWSMNALQLLEAGTAPDLSRWVPRCLRASRLDAAPEPDAPEREAWDREWDRLTLRDRSAGASVSHLIPSWKFDAPGHWVLAPAEIDILRRASKATPPRHKPSDAQAAIWRRWMALVDAESVELHVR